MELLYASIEEKKDESVIEIIRRRAQIMNGVYYEMIVNIVGLAQTMMVIYKEITPTNNLESLRNWFFMSIIINTTFLLEMLIYIFVCGGFSKAFANRFRIWPELLCQLINLYSCIMLYI